MRSTRSPITPAGRSTSTSASAASSRPAPTTGPSSSSWDGDFEARSSPAQAGAPPYSRIDGPPRLRPLQEVFDLVPPGFRVGLPELDQAAQVVGLEHEEGEQVVRP